MLINRIIKTITAMSLLVASMPASAALIYGHLHPDLVLDSETGLIWMPVNSTAEDLANFNALGRDQRLAGRDEVFDLFGREFGLPFGSIAQIDAATFGRLQTFANFISDSTQDPGFGLCPVGQDCVFVSGAYFDGATVPLPVPRDVVAFELALMYFWEDNGAFFGASTTTLGGWAIPGCVDDPGGFSCAGASSWIVMSAVPLPGALGLMCLGCFSLFGFGLLRN